MTRIWQRLYLGSIGDAEVLAQSNPHSITTVISLCREPLRSRAKAVNYLRFPIEDGRPIPLAQFDATLKAMFENIRTGNVLVHCMAGLSRSPVIIAAWMATVGYKNIGPALAQIARLRPIDPSPILLNSVREALR